LRGAAAAGLSADLLSGVSGSSNLRMPQIEPRLNEKDKALVRLFMAACFHRWELLEGGPIVGAVHDACLARAGICILETSDVGIFTGLGKACYTVGCTVAEVRGCVRHLIV
jgi:hypothetical protein